MLKHDSNGYTFKKFLWGRSLSGIMSLLLLLLFTLLFLLSCDQSFSLIESLDGPQSVLPADESAPLSLSPASIGVFIGSNAQFTVSGGEPPYSFSLTEGIGSISESGLYSAPITPGTATVRLIDNVGTIRESAVTVSDIVTNVDYDITLLNDTSPTHVGGDPLTGDFSITNIGVSNGTKSVYWFAYLSNDATFSGDDTLIDAGVTGQLLSGESISIGFSGLWPETAGTYQFIIQTNAIDDIQNTSNNSEVSGGILISGTPPPDVDYQINSTPVGGGSAVAGTTLSESFSIENIGTDDGSFTLYWTAYASSDINLDVGTDLVIDSGNRSPLTAGQASPALTISGSWPVSAGTYYLIVSVSSGDDMNSLNNNGSSSSIVIVDPLAISPAIASLTTGGAWTFSASGGVPPYVFSISSTGSGSPSIDSGSGAYTAGSGAGTDILRVTDSQSSIAESTVTVSVPASDVNYDSVTVANTGGTTGGNPLSGEFTFANSGTGNGGQLVNWQVYTSLDTVIGAGDSLVDSGTEAPLNSGATSASVPFSGNWPVPSSDTTYYLLVRIQAADDITTVDNEGNTSVLVTAPIASDIDYLVNSLPVGGSTVVAGSSLSDSFTVENTGSNDGVLSLYWTAYVSSDANLDVGTDLVIDSGNRSPLTAGQISPPISVSGVWPVTAGTYYLIIGLSSGDDANVVNNDDSSASPFTVVDSLGIDPAVASLSTGGSWTFAASGGVPPYVFSISSAGSGSPSIDSGTGAYTAGGGAGIDILRVTDSQSSYAESTVTVSVPASDVNYDSVTVANTGGTAGGNPLTGEFTFSNSGTGNGTQSVNWQVYTSLDSIIGAGDSLIDSGTETPLNSGATSASVPFSGNWPVPSSDTTYYLLVSIQAADDITTVDNQGDTSVLVTAPVSSDIDYIVQSISNSPSSADTSTPVGQTFTFYNQGSDPGANTAYWFAYISDDMTLDGGDLQIDNGSASALGASSASSAINISGNWPASAGIYYLIVQVSSSDDTIPSNNVSVSSPFTINATASDIDYIVTNVTRYYPTVTSGSLVSESFDLSNIGGLNGSQPIDWSAYASTDTVRDGGDFLIGSGTTPFSGLNSGASYSGISITGNWPASAGSYYLIVEVSSSDETITGNNSKSEGLFSLNDPPDYNISSASIQYDGIPTTSLDSFGTYNFTISETAGNDGNQPIGWKVYASVDNVLDGSDVLIKEGSRTALAASGVSGAISFGDALWPAFGSYYYLIININSGDDSNSSNNTYISAIVTVPEIYTEGGEDNSETGTTAVPLTLVSDLSGTLQGGLLNDDELIRIDGIMDAKFLYDTYKFVAGPGVTELDIHAVWSTGFDEIDLALWDESSGEWLSEDWNVDGEPISPAPPATFSASPGATYYVGVRFMRAGGEGAPYSLFIRGK